MSGDEHGELERWDAWGRWWEPFLWTCVEVLTITAPAEIFEGFLMATVGYLTGHEFEGGH